MTFQSVSSLLRLVLIVLQVAPLAASSPVAFPNHPNVVNVTRPPYLAKGDGLTDDTAALQQAINEHTGRHRIIYLPDGVYLVSATLTWPKRWGDRDNWGQTTIQGQSRDGTILRLKDATFTDPEKPQAMMWCGGFGSADWFHNYVGNLTFQVGRGNPGAVGLQFYSNNSGAVRDCLIATDDGQGHTGLDLAHRDMNGPLLVRHLEVRGFRTGVRTGHAVNSQCFEFLRLSGQTEVGLNNEGQTLSIRKLTSDNAVPAVKSYGTLSLIDATLVARGAATNGPALVNYNGGNLHVRDLTTRGYAVALRSIASPDYQGALRDQAGAPGTVRGPVVGEFFSRKPTSPFALAAGSLRLPVEETPEAPADDPGQWAVVDAFGADPTGERDSAAAIQQAIDSGASTVFFPGHYQVQSTVLIRGKVRRLLGVGGHIDYFGKVKPDLRILDGEAPAVFLEHFSTLGGGIEIATSRRVVLKSMEARTLVSRGAGDVFLEDVVSHGLAFARQRVFARQLNVENEGTHLVNDGGSVWILGYKTERGGTLLETRGGGKTEVLGNFSYTTTAGALAPMFVNRESSLFTFFNEICYTGDPFQTLIEETRGGVTKQVRRGEGSTAPYLGGAVE